jgi:hypothetical protein
MTTKRETKSEKEAQICVEELARRMLSTPPEPRPKRERKKPQSKAVKAAKPRGSV